MLFFILFLILLGGRLGCLRFLFLCLCCYELLLLHPVDFVWLCFHCQFPQDILKFCDFIDLLDLSSMFFQSPCIFFLFFFWLISVFMLLWSETMLEVISIHLNLFRLRLCLSMWWILENVPCALVKTMYSFLGGGCNGLKISIKSVLFYYIGSLLLYFLSPRSIHCCEWDIKVSSYCIPINFSLYVC